MAENDFLDEIVDERTAKNPNFPRLVENARRRRELLGTLAAERESQRVSQTQVAASMGSSQSSLARLERTAVDAKLSTVEKLANALGLAVQYHLVDADAARNKPSVVVHR
ncbi:MAG: helix-turn-helix domain-containing protein [Pyrinomonadaceae bacterium]